MVCAAFPYQKQRGRVLAREMAYVEVTGALRARPTRLPWRGPPSAGARSPLTSRLGCAPTRPFAAARRSSRPLGPRPRARRCAALPCSAARSRPRPAPRAGVGSASVRAVAGWIDTRPTWAMQPRCQEQQDGDE